MEVGRSEWLTVACRGVDLTWVHDSVAGSCDRWECQGCGHPFVPWQPNASARTGRKESAFFFFHALVDVAVKKQKSVEENKVAKG